MGINSKEITEIRSRFEERNTSRFDAESTETQGRGRGRRGGSKRGNTKLPYGIAKSMGIDTSGMAPKEVWKEIMGEGGISPKEAYKSLSKGKTGKEIVNTSKKNAPSTPKSYTIKSGEINKEQCLDMKIGTVVTNLAGDKYEKTGNDEWSCTLSFGGNIPIPGLNSAFVSDMLRQGGNLKVKEKSVGSTEKSAGSSKNTESSKTEQPSYQPPKTMYTMDVHLSDVNDYPVGTVLNAGNVTMTKDAANKWTVKDADYGTESEFDNELVFSTLQDYATVKISSNAASNNNSSGASSNKPTNRTFKYGELTQDHVRKFPVGTVIKTSKFTITKNPDNRWTAKNAAGATKSGYSDEIVYSGVKNAKEIKVSYGGNGTASNGERRSGTSKAGLVSGTEDIKAFKQQMKNAKKYATAQEADDALREKVGNEWSKLDHGQKELISAYTGSAYHGINDSLIGKSNGFDYHEDRIVAMTEFIDKLEFEEDTMLYRGVGRGGFSNMFGLDADSLLSVDPKSLVGMVGKNEGFSSCGTVKGTGFTSKPVSMRILCPKGTKGAYAEPWSKCGNGHGTSWDGKQKQSYFSSEDETILQRGTSFKIVGATRTNNKLKVDVVVIDQDPKTLFEIKEKNGWLF